eukprot:1815041-Pyramimonas_sp.AAC.1
MSDARLEQTGVEPECSRVAGLSELPADEVLWSVACAKVSGLRKNQGNQYHHSISNNPEYSLVPNPRYPLDSVQEGLTPLRPPL